MIPALLLVPCGLLQTAGVDYAALKAELAAFRTGLEAAYQKAQQAGQAQPDLAACRAQGAAVQARAAKAAGEEREALTLLDFILSGYLVREADPAAAQTRLRAAVPATSRAWSLEPQLAVYVAMASDAGDGVYGKTMREHGIPEVRAAFLGVQVRDLFFKGDLEGMRQAVARLEREFPQAKATQEAAKVLADALRTPVGQPAPGFSVPSLDDPKVALTAADFKGRYLLLDFWGTWCGWCVKELPTTHQLYAQYKGRGLEILSLSTDPKPETVAAFRAKPGSPMPWRHGFLGSDPARKHPVLEAFGVQGFPSLFLIGPDGKLLAKGEDLREAKLAQTLERLLPPAPRP